MSELSERVDQRASIARLRGLYRASVQDELAYLRELAEVYALPVGEQVGPSEALDGWREAAIAALAQRSRSAG